MLCRAPTSGATCTGSSPTGQQLSYDTEGNLTGWQDAPSSPSSTASMLYDGEGDRVEQVTTSTAGGGGGTSTTTRYLAGGLEELATTGSTTQVTKYYPTGVGGVTALSVNGSYSYLASDGLGSVSEALSSSGAVTAQQLYAPYGGVRYASGALPGSLGYTGQHSDGPGGLAYYGARYYDPTAGQFASADTVLDGGLNRYAYVGDNPETLSDPSGHMVGKGFESGGGAVDVATDVDVGVGDPGIADPSIGAGGVGVIATLGGVVVASIVTIILSILQHAGPATTPTVGAGPTLNEGQWAAHGYPPTVPTTGSLGTGPGAGGGGGGGGTPPTTPTPTTPTPTAPTTLPVTQSWTPPTSYPSVSSDDPCIDAGALVRNACVQFGYGVPQGLTEETFLQVAAMVRAAAGHLGSDIYVQGSRAAGTAGPDSDIDFAILVSQGRFDQIIASRFKTPNPGSSKEKTMLWAIDKGKIQAGEIGLHGFSVRLNQFLGGMDVDISVILAGGSMDTGPMIELP